MVCHCHVALAPLPLVPNELLYFGDNPSNGGLSRVDSVRLNGIWYELVFFYNAYHRWPTTRTATAVCLWQTRGSLQTFFASLIVRGSHWYLHSVIQWHWPSRWLGYSGQTSIRYLLAFLCSAHLHAHLTTTWVWPRAVEESRLVREAKNQLRSKCIATKSKSPDILLSTLLVHGAAGSFLWLSRPGL